MVGAMNRLNCRMSAKLFIQSILRIEATFTVPIGKPMQ